MGKPCSCTQFIKSRILYYKSRKNPYQYYIVTRDTDGNKLVIFSGIALNYGDTKTFSGIALNYGDTKTPDKM